MEISETCEVLWFLIHSRMELWLFESLCCTFTRMYAPRWDMVRCTLEK